MYLLDPVGEKVLLKYVTLEMIPSAMLFSK
jgi:hypothetical protein